MDEPTYHDGMRRLQDLRETRALADRLEKVTMRSAFTDEDKAFVQRCRMFFLATADTHGQPDCSYKGGLPGFVRVVDDRTLAIPDYDGNGQYRSWGNVLANPRVGMLFIDFESPKRLRVNGSAVVSQHDPLLAAFPGAAFVIRLTAERIFPNCPRYIHKMQLVEESVYAPRPDYTPPVPAWKTFDVFKDALPPRDRTPGKPRTPGARCESEHGHATPRGIGTRLLDLCLVLPVLDHYSGWQAFVTALRGPFLDSDPTRGDAAILQLLSALTNVAFVALSMHYRKGITRPWLYLKLALLCLLIDLYWLVEALRAGEAASLLIGYYVWLMAFALLVTLGAVSVVSARRTSKTPTADTPA